MRSIRVFVSRLFGLFRAERLEHDMNEEFDFHLENEVAENIRRGMDAEEAWAEARHRFGGVAQLKEAHRETRSLPFLEELWQDLHFGFRMLLRSPGFSILAILCLTLGIGATTAVFSWIEGVLLRPFAGVAHQDRMMAIAGTYRNVDGVPGDATELSWPDFQDLQKYCKLSDAFIVDRITGVTLAIGNRAERAVGSVVSANYFDALGVRPIIGRGFKPDENFSRNAHPVVVISYQMWKERFRGDPSIIGTIQILNGLPHTIIGVAPKGFYGIFVGWAMQFWVPVSMQERFIPGGYQLEDRGAPWIEGFVRLKTGVTRQQAQAEISAVANRLEHDYPVTNRGRGARLFPLWKTPFNNAGTMFPMLSVGLAVVCFVLLIACANVGNLLLVKAFGRRHEMTVRQAVGAGRGRLLKQLLTEGLILSATAAALGVLVANWCRNLLPLLLPSRGGVMMRLPGEIDWRVLVLSAGVCLASAVFFGLVPILQSSRLDLVSALKAESSGVVGGNRRAVLRGALIVVQVSLSFALLVGAGLLLKSLGAIRKTNPGFTTHALLVTWVDSTAAGYDMQRTRNFQDALSDRLESLPGVQSVAFARVIPFSNSGSSSAPISVDGYVRAPEEDPTVDYDEVGPGYFTTMGIPLMGGREFTSADKETAPLVAVVNESMATKYWRNRSPVDSRLNVKGRWMRVVGVAKMSKYRNLSEARKPFFYVAMRQMATGLNLALRTSLGPEVMTKALVREIHALDANLAPGEVITMQEQVDRTTAVQRVSGTMLAAFAGLALLLAAIGLYGVISYTVSQSTRELALRMALGASTSNVLRLVLSRGLALTAGGVVLGVAVALILTRLMGNLLYNVNPRDPSAFGSALAVMAIATLAACFLPARRAARTDPVKAFRQ